MFVNVHNYGLNQANMKAISEFVLINEPKSTDRGGSRTTWIGGDFNFAAEGEVPMRIKVESQAPVEPQDQQRLQGQKKWCKILDNFTEFASPHAYSHYYAKTDTFNRIDRVYTNMDRWALPICTSFTIMLQAPDILHAKGISDHAPIGVVLHTGTNKPK